MKRFTDHLREGLSWKKSVVRHRETGKPLPVHKWESSDKRFSIWKQKDSEFHTLHDAEHPKTNFGHAKNIKDLKIAAKYQLQSQISKELKEGFAPQIITPDNIMFYQVVYGSIAALWLAGIVSDLPRTVGNMWNNMKRKYKDDQEISKAMQTDFAKLSDEILKNIPSEWSSQRKTHLKKLLNAAKTLSSATGEDKKIEYGKLVREIQRYMSVHGSDKKTTMKEGVEHGDTPQPKPEYFQKPFNISGKIVQLNPVFDVPVKTKSYRRIRASIGGRDGYRPGEASPGQKAYDAKMSVWRWRVRIQTDEGWMLMGYIGASDRKEGLPPIRLGDTVEVTNLKLSQRTGGNQMTYADSWVKGGYTTYSDKAVDYRSENFSRQLHGKVKRKAV
jgi:gas vesicle protein